MNAVHREGGNHHGKSEIHCHAFRRDRNHDESLAEKTMREVYSAHRDIVDYDRLNKVAAARLVEKGAGDKAIREVAKIAGTFDWRITDTRAYARTLSKQVGRAADR